MTDKRTTQQALERSLSGLKENPFLAQRVLEQAKGDQPMKKHISRSAILAVALLLILAGTAYAAFSSQVADFFGRHWNKELGEWLQDGKIAQIGDSVTVGGVTFTLDEVVYRNLGIYGVGTARVTDEKDVFVPEMLTNMPEYFLQDETALAQVAKAQSSGGRLLYIHAMPTQVSVDGGEMMHFGTIGYYDVLNEDGSLTFSFTAEDGLALSEGERYTLHMETTVYALNPDGTTVNDSRETLEWDVEFVPALAAGTAAPSEAAPVSLPETPYAVNVPEGYGGTLPIYKAAARDFSASVQPEWFNASGVTKSSNGVYDFADEAQLIAGGTTVSYREYDGEYDYNTVYRSENPDIAPDISKKGAFSWAVLELASWASHGSRATNDVYALENTALTNVTLADAQALAEELLQKLQIDGYLCDTALDMSLQRIVTLGEALNQAQEEHQYFTNGPVYDYSTATEADEGYYLHYSPMGVDGANEGLFSAVFFITARGVAYLYVRDEYARGEIASTPDALIAPEDALEALARYAATAQSQEKIVSVESVSLTYAPVRAENPQDGIVLSPCWLILFRDESGAERGYTRYAEINAVTGTLIATDL